MAFELPFRFGGSAGGPVSALEFVSLAKGEGFLKGDPGVLRDGIPRQGPVQGLVGLGDRGLPTFLPPGSSRTAPGVGAGGASRLGGMPAMVHGSRMATSSGHPLSRHGLS